MKKEEESAKKKKGPKTSPAQLRVQKDLTELELPRTMKTDFADPADVLNFTLTIEPDEGMCRLPLSRITTVQLTAFALQVCTRRDRSSSPLQSTTTTRTSRQRSNARKR